MRRQNILQLLCTLPAGCQCCCFRLPWSPSPAVRQSAFSAAPSAHLADPSRDVVAGPCSCLLSSWRHLCQLHLCLLTPCGCVFSWPACSCGKGTVVCLMYPVRHIALAAIFRACKANKLQWYLKPQPGAQAGHCADENVPEDLTLAELKCELLCCAVQLSIA